MLVQSSHHQWSTDRIRGWSWEQTYHDSYRTEESCKPNIADWPIVFGVISGVERVDEPLDLAKTTSQYFASRAME